MTSARISTSGSAYPEQTIHCVVRKQAHEYLIYNSRTDELHLLPATGYFVYQLCDGLRTVEEIETELAASLDSIPGAVHEALVRFLADLA
jgi:hypothetical protein